jgi:WD40 repeat protein
MLNCVSWSPNDPQTLVVCGGYDKKLVIFDTRLPTSEKNGIVWSADNAHDRPIRDAKFNPFIPYWVASAGNALYTTVFINYYLDLIFLYC